MSAKIGLTHAQAEALGQFFHVDPGLIKRSLFSRIDKWLESTHPKNIYRRFKVAIAVNKTTLIKHSP